MESVKSEKSDSGGVTGEAGRVLASGGRGHGQLLQVLQEHLQTDIVSQNRGPRLL